MSGCDELAERFRLVVIRPLRILAAVVVSLAFASAGALASPSSVAAAECGLPTCTLTVTLGGTGSGTWLTTNSSGTPNGYINCQLGNGGVPGPSICSHVYGGEVRATPLVIYFYLIPDVGSNGCAGTCSEAAQHFQFTLLYDTEKFADFSLQNYEVDVGTSGSGFGKVTSYPEGIVCPFTCNGMFLYGTELDLTAVAQLGSYFAGWTGLCAGQPARCSIGVGVSTSTDAVFGLGSAPTPSPSAGAPTPSATADATVRPTGTPTATTLRPRHSELQLAARPVRQPRVRRPQVCWKHPEPVRAHRAPSELPRRPRGRPSSPPARPTGPRSCSWCW